MSSLEKLFHPGSIAVVGVSNEPQKIGSVVFSNIKDFGYRGKLYPVNPKYDELFGQRCYKNLSDIPGRLDLVVIAIPAVFIKDVIKDAGRKKVKAAIIISAGFRETGEEGFLLEEELKKEAKKYNIRLLGPNCLGMINPLAKINASFAASNPIEGNIAFLSQSGAFCTAILDMSLEKQVGFSHFVSIGNKADIDENDLIEYWQNLPEVKVIGAYLEEIKKGRQLLELMQKKQIDKSLIIFKPGETQEAKKAISSHTGSMAGSTETFKRAILQNGIIQANEVNQMFNMMMGFSWSNLPKGNRIAIITNAGGPGIIATDDVIRSGLKLADVSTKSQDEMRKHLPATASVSNPVDVIGDALAQRYSAPIDILVNDENVDAILIILTPQLVTQIEETAKLIISSAKATKKPIFTVFLGGKYTSFGLQRLFDNKIPAFSYINDAVEVLSSMYKYNQYLKSKIKQDINRDDLLRNVYKGKKIKKIKNISLKETKALPENIVEQLALEVGIDLPKQIVTNSCEEAIRFAEGKYPIVIKATTEVIAHKTDEKALYLNVQDPKTLIDNFNTLASMMSKHTDNIKILVQEQILSKEEMIIGANRDGSSDVYQKDTKGFGHLIIFGKGGIFTEIYQDFQSVLVPATKEEIIKSLDETKVSKILNGFRGLSPLAKNKVIDTIEAIQKLVLLYPQIESIDLNPLLVTETRAVAVDLKIFVSD